MSAVADVEIRAARPADLGAVHKLETASFPAPWRREFFESELRASGRLSLVATRRRQVIGYVFAMWIFDEMHINKIAVLPDERRQGVADALMDRCLAFAREHGVTTMSLEVRQTNSGAIGFYKHLGFESSYVRPRYYPDGEAAVVMTRRIDGDTVSS
jgi:[ribosomal protein S18]-alanine N-acetyltransferase